MFKGTIIISHEGMNGTISCENDNVKKLIIFQPKKNQKQIVTLLIPVT